MIVVFGSLNIDFLAKCTHLPQPGETVITPQDYLEAPGGKGMNQAVAAARAGACVMMAGKIGADGFGEKLRHILGQENINIDYLQTGAKKTALAFIFVDEAGKNLIVVASGANMEAAAEQVPDSVLTREAILVLQMEVTSEQNWEIISRAKQNGTRIILNCAPMMPVPEASLKEIDYLIVNEIEAQQLASRLGLEASENKFKDLAVSFHSRYGMTCIITLGAAGAIAASREGITEVAALALDQVIDTTGAGDSFCGNFAAALDAGCTLQEAMKRACIGGSLACLKMGAQTALPSYADLEKYL
jgi:ribokinase